MNIFSTLKSKQKTIIIAGSLLIGLALPIAVNAQPHGKGAPKYNNGHHIKHNKQGHNSRTYYVVEEPAKHHPAAKQHHQTVVVKNAPHHPEPAGVKIGVHTDLFDIVIRD